MSNKDWNPELYLKFNKERIQPSIDLVSRINYDQPKKIIDIGCGPGNSTQILVQKWPDAQIIGIDNSPAMIEKAKKDFPLQEWKLIDAGKEKIDGKFDIVFSNAAIQWIPNHNILIEKFHHLLNKDGQVAVQIPLFWDMPLGKAIADIAENSQWAKLTKNILGTLTIHNHSYYYNQLSSFFNFIEMWKTDYFHIMESHNSILEMIKSTGLKPFIEVLKNKDDKEKFENLVLENIKKEYLQQLNGKVLFPFKRLFFIARQKHI